MKKVLARIVLDYIGFIRRHKFFGTLLSLVLLAACAGGLYIIAVEFPTFVNLPCLTGCNK